MMKFPERSKEQGQLQTASNYEKIARCLYGKTMQGNFMQSVINPISNVFVCFPFKVVPLCAILMRNRSSNIFPEFMSIGEHNSGKNRHVTDL